MYRVNRYLCKNYILKYKRNKENKKCQQCKKQSNTQTEKEKASVLKLEMFYLRFQLVLEPSQVEMQIGAVHGRLRPTRNFRDDSRGHVGDEAVLTVQEVQKRPPDAFFFFLRVLMEYLNTTSIFLLCYNTFFYTLSSNWVSFKIS